MRPARLGPLLIEAAGRERRDRLAVGGNAHEVRRAGRDLYGDDLSVAAHVGIVEAAGESDLLLPPAALDVEVRALLIRIRVVDLREQERAVRERDVRRLTVAAAEVRPSAVEIDLQRGEALPARRAGVH